MGGVKRLSLEGHRFSRLLVLERIPNMGAWVCQCDCGKTVNVSTNNLTRGNTGSCGCSRRGQKRLIHARTHGHTIGGKASPEYRSWQNMIGRCYYPSSPSWQWYGAKGITVCDRWRHSFEAFLADMGPRPESMSLDRINNDKSYSPDNCRWATDVGQAKNRSASTTRSESLKRAYAEGRKQWKAPPRDAATGRWTHLKRHRAHLRSA